MRSAFRARNGLLAMSLAIGLSAIGPPSVVAECDGPAISFRTHAASAPTVVIGEVSAINPDRIVPDDDDAGRSRAFSLTIQYVLRGSTGRTLELEDLASGPCSGPVTVRVGERIAIAFGLSDRLLFGDATWAAVAWIQGTPPRLPDIEQLTVSDVFRTLGVEPPDTSTAAPARHTVPIGLVLVVVLGVVAIVGMRPFPQGGSGDINER